MFWRKAAAPAADSFGFDFNGRRVTGADYGTGYISELCRVLDRYAPDGIQAILEWGSGLTTQVFADYGSRKWRSQLLLTIDEDQVYQESIFKGLPVPGFVKFKIIDQMGPKLGQVDPELNYSTYPLASGRKFDLIFIDGRRRMECAFMAALVSKPSTIVILHDYRRTRYQPILALHQVVEDGSQFRVLRPRPEVLQAVGEGAATAVAGMQQLLRNNNLPLD